VATAEVARIPVQATDSLADSQGARQGLVQGRSG
jgi:hypothetical protein